MKKRIEINMDIIEELIRRLESRSLTEKDYDLIKELIATVVNVNQELERKNLSIQRLKKLFHIHHLPRFISYLPQFYYIIYMYIHHNKFCGFYEINYKKSHEQSHSYMPTKFWLSVPSSILRKVILS